MIDMPPWFISSHVAVYGFVLSPNQTPYRDQIFLKLLVGLRDPGEQFVVNQVYASLFNIMGIWPIIYACLIIPSGRSANKASMVGGMRTLYSYACLCQACVAECALSHPSHPATCCTALVFLIVPLAVLPMLCFCVLALCTIANASTAVPTRPAAGVSTLCPGIRSFRLTLPCTGLLLLISSFNDSPFPPACAGACVALCVGILCVWHVCPAALLCVLEAPKGATAAASQGRAGASLLAPIPLCFYHQSCPLSECRML